MDKKDLLNSYSRWKENYKINNESKSLDFNTQIRKSGDKRLTASITEHSETKESSTLQPHCLSKMEKEDTSYFRFSSIEPKNLFCGEGGKVSRPNSVVTPVSQQNKPEIIDTLITKSKDRSSFQSTSLLVNTQNNVGSKKIKIKVAQKENLYPSTNKVVNAKSKEEKTRLCLVSCAISIILLCAIVISIQAVKSINLKGIFI